MKKNQNELSHEGYSHEQSNYKMYDEYNILDPAPGSDMQFLDDDDDELSDYSLMDSAHDLDDDE